MENLGEICIPPCLWSNQYDNISESSSNYSITSSNIELNDPSFIPSSEIQRLINCEANSDLHGVGEEMMSILTPPFESINDSLDLDFSGQIESFFSFQVPAIFPQGEIIQNSKLSSENQCNAIDDRSKSDTKRAETSTAVDDTTSNNNNKRKYREERGFHITFETPSSGKKPKLEKKFKCSSLVDFREGNYEPDMEAIAQVKEMIYRAAALRPVNLGAEEAGEKPRRKNVRISSDPQTVAARHRRERISERLRVLQKLVPGGTKMDTASMLDEAANYLKFLKSQVSALETLGNNNKFDSMSNNSNFHSNPTLSFPIPLNQGFTMFHHPKP